MTNAATQTPATGARKSLQPALEALAMSRWFLNRVVSEIPESDMLVRTCPGGNHATWCVGHIAAVEQLVLTQLSDRPRVLPESWDAIFTASTPPVDDASVYPGKAELMRLAEATRAELVDWLCSLSEEELAAPVQGDLQVLAKTYAQLPCSLTMHEGVHAGQASAARRATGKPALF